MSIKKYWKAIKIAANYFGVGAGSVSLVLVIISAFVVVAPYISLPLVAGVGLAIAIWAGRNTAIKINKQDNLTRKRAGTTSKIERRSPELKNLSPGRNLTRQRAETMSEIERRSPELRNQSPRKKTPPNYSLGSTQDSRAIFSAMNIQPLKLPPQIISTAILPRDTSDFQPSVMSPTSLVSPTSSVSTVTPVSQVSSVRFVSPVRVHSLPELQWPADGLQFVAAEGPAKLKLT